MKVHDSKQVRWPAKVIRWMRDMAGNPVAVVDGDGKTYRLRRCVIRRDGDMEIFEGEPVGDDEVLIYE